MATVVYALCAATSILCAVLLWRGHRRSRTRLLLWSCWCFAFLAVNNVLLVIDLSIVTGTDLSLARSLTGLAGLALLVYGLIFELDEGPTA